MKRDMDLVRQILLLGEGVEAGRELKLDIEGYPDEVTARHADLMKEAGLLDAMVMKTGQGYGPVVLRGLTWDGHSFLDAVKNDTVWKRVKARVAKEGGNVPFELLKPLAVKIAGSALGLDP